NKPFIYLSAGVSNAEFTESLELAAESGVKFNGVLCGRATWKDGIPIYASQGASAFRKWLESDGVKNIENVNQRLKAATPPPSGTARVWMRPRPARPTAGVRTSESVT
ncbi:MAG TPA: hypothetical protein VGK60_03615, partial [Pedococcus sp.]